MGHQPDLEAGGISRVTLVGEFVREPSGERRKWAKNTNLRRIDRHGCSPNLVRSGESVPLFWFRLCRPHRSVAASGGGHPPTRRHNPDVGMLNLTSLNGSVPPEGAPDRPWK